MKFNKNFAPLYNPSPHSISKYSKYFYFQFLSSILFLYNILNKLQFDISIRTNGNYILYLLYSSIVFLIYVQYVIIFQYFKIFSKCEIIICNIKKNIFSIKCISLCRRHRSRRNLVNNEQTNSNCKTREIRRSST